MQKSGGFTLMELMVVIAIIGIMSAVAIPNVFSWMQNRHFTGSLQRTVSVMNAAKMRAVKENARAVIDFDTSAHSFRAFVDRSNPPNNTWDPDTDQQIDFFQMPQRVRVTHASFAGGVSRIRFDGRGMPNGLGGRVELTASNGNASAVRVNVTGRISVGPVGE